MADKFDAKKLTLDNSYKATAKDRVGQTIDMKGNTVNHNQRGLRDKKSSVAKPRPKVGDTAGDGEMSCERKQVITQECYWNNF